MILIPIIDEDGKGTVIDLADYKRVSYKDGEKILELVHRLGEVEELEYRTPKQAKEAVEKLEKKAKEYLISLEIIREKEQELEYEIGF